MHDADDARTGLSPAARSLLFELDDPEAEVPAAGPTILELRANRQEAMLMELVEAGLAYVLDRGHIISETALARIGQWISAQEFDEFELADIADIWGVSRGRCKSILSWLVHVGRLEKVDGGYQCT